MPKRACRSNFAAAWSERGAVTDGKSAPDRMYGVPVRGKFVFQWKAKGVMSCCSWRDGAVNNVRVQFALSPVLPGNW